MSIKLSSLKKVKSAKERLGKKVNWYYSWWESDIIVRRGIAYSPHARRLKRMDSRLLKNIFKCFLTLEKNSLKNYSFGEVKLHKLDNVKGNVGNGFFKLEVGKRKFFLKVLKNNGFSKYNLSVFHDLAISQHRALIEAKELIKSSKFKDFFDVVTPHFAFVSDKYSFQVVEFCDFQRVEDILNKPKSKMAELFFEKKSIYESGLKFLEEKGFHDLGEHNTFFSPISGKFIVFDVRRYPVY